MGNTPGKSLSERFNTRNASDVSEGLRRMVQMQAEIVEDQHAEFVSAQTKADATGDPADAPNAKQIAAERDSLMNNLDRVIKNSAKLYQLDKPSQAVNVNVGVATQLVGAGSTAIDARNDSPRVLVSKAIAELNEAGIEPTDDAIEYTINSYLDQQKEIEGEVIEGDYA